jgi:hypothetical protein
MPKLLRILLPLTLSALVLSALASAAPLPTTPFTGGYFGNAPHSANYEWVTSERAYPNVDAVDANNAISDAAFSGKYYFQGSYNVSTIYDITDPYHPVRVSSMRCQGSQGDVIVHGNLFIVSKESTHSIPYGDLNRACETAGTNSIQRISLLDFNQAGDSYTLRFGGNDTVPIVWGQNNTTAGVVAALQGGNELNTISLSNFNVDGNSYTLNLGGNNTVPITRGQNNTAAGVQAALQGGNEQQQVILTGFTTGSSYTLQMGGQTSSVQLVGGTNHNAATIQGILLGVDEQQTVSFGGAFNPTTGDQFTVSIGGQTSAAIPASPGALTAAEIQTAVNAISGFAGTVTASSVTNSGFTLTFGGASRKANVANVNIGFAACASSCTASVNEAVQGRAPLHSSLLDATVTVGTVSNAGYTLTFSGTLANTDVLPLSVVNQASMTSGTVRENVKGTAGVAGWPAGGTVTVGTVADTGYTLTFAGSWANTDVPGTVTVTNGTGSPAVTGTTRENVRGGPGVTGWPAGGTVTTGTIPGGTTPTGSHNNEGYTLTFTGTLAGTNPAMMSVTNGVGASGFVERTTVAAPGATWTGLGLWDISDKANPKFIRGVPVCGGGHTATGFVDKAKNRMIVYMTRSGVGTSRPEFGLSCAGLPGGRETAVVIPLSNPKAAYVASENIPTGFGSGGCHDVNVHVEAKLLAMACAGGGGLGVADITDPLNPTLKWTFTWPGLATTHTADLTYDAKYIYLNGEPGGGTGQECAFDDDVIKPTMHIMEAQTGKVLGHWSLPRPQNTSNENCTIHEIQMVPFVGRHIMAMSFYQGGMNIVDLTNPKAPREIGYMDIPAPPSGSGLGFWTAYVYNGYQYGSDISWGFHVWKLNEPWWQNQLHMDEMNPQVINSRIKCKISFTGGPTKAMQLANATATVQLYGPAALQPGKGVKVRFEAPGYSKEAITDENGQATVPVIGNKAGNIRVSAPVQVNLADGCVAKLKSIKKAAR